MRARCAITTSLLTAATAAGVIGCGDPEPDPESSAAPGADETSWAGASRPSEDFLDAYAETYRFGLGHPRAIELLPDGTGVLFLRSGPRSREGVLHLFDAETREERPLLTAAQLLGDAPEELSEEEAARRERMRLSARGIASFVLSPDGSRLVVPLSGRLFLVDRERIGEEGAIRELTSEAGSAVDPRFSPDGTHIATVRRGDLYVIDVATGAERRLTTRAGEHVTNGLAEFVAQEEMDRMRGFWWSPDGRAIAFEEADTSQVERMHILDPMHPENEPSTWPYPRPGQANASVRLGIVAIHGGAPRWVSWDRDAMPYLASVTWPAAGPLTVLVQDRPQETELLLAVDPTTGETSELLREHDEAWLNIDQSVPRWVGDGAQFLWSTEREGGWQLELRGADGGLVRALTTPAQGYRELLHVDEAAGLAWVSASAESTEDHVVTVALSGEGEPAAKTEGRGVFRATVADAGGLWVESRQPLEGAPTFVVRRGEETLGELRSDAEEPPITPSLEFETVGSREWRAVIVRPSDFDESRVYPVILHVYGGPHVRYVTASPRRYLLSQWQANHGFIVVTIDGRGTPGRGREWERTIDGDFISAPLEDQVEALSQLGERHPELDMERVGVWGWSFGGYFSAMAALRRPDIFRAAVAGAPVSEWRDYDTHYTERYLGLPEPDGEERAYYRSSVLTFAVEAPAEQHRPLLIIHGTADDNVYFSHALKLQNALFRAGRPAELLALSGLTHMVPEAEVMRRMHRRVMDFFEASLRR